MIVYTSITGGRNELIEEQNTTGAEYVAFTDTPSQSKTWDIRPAYQEFRDNRRNSRIVKMMPDKFFDTKYSLYMDGNMQLKVPMQQLIDEWLDGYDVAIFKHSMRDCIYDEGLAVCKLGFDDPEIVGKQLSRYERGGYPKHNGLCENGFILRRHTNKVREWGEAWFGEYCAGARRDQLSAMYCAHRVGLRINMIQGDRGENVYTHPYLKVYNHTGGSRKHENPYHTN
jgi:hypothetical protein